MQLFVGTARKKITPSPDLTPNLRGLMNAVFDGVVDDLFVRVLAFDIDGIQALMVSFDLDKAPCPTQFLPLIVSETKIPQENILYFSTHAHSVPIISDRPFEKMNDKKSKPLKVQKAIEAYEKFVEERLMEAVKEALDGLEPARLGIGYGKSHINVNRNQDYSVVDENGETSIFCGLGTNFEGITDSTLFVMKIENDKGDPIAFFMNYPLHNVVMMNNHCGKDGKVAFSSDIAGNVCQYLESRFEKSVALWSSGAGADINPIISNSFFYPDPITGERKIFPITNPETPLALLKFLSATHMADVMKTLETMEYINVDEGIKGVIEWSSTPGRAYVVNEQDETIIKEAEDTPPYIVRLQLLKIGPVAFFGAGGELYNALGREIKNASPMKNTIVMNHVASLIADSNYIYDDEAFARSENVVGGVHAIDHTRMRPGYIHEALKSYTEKMFQEIL